MTSMGTAMIASTTAATRLVVECEMNMTPISIASINATVMVMRLAGPEKAGRLVAGTLSHG